MNETERITQFVDTIISNEYATSTEKYHEETTNKVKLVLKVRKSRYHIRDRIGRSFLSLMDSISP